MIEVIVDPTDPNGLDRAFSVARSPGDRIVARNGRFVTKGNWGFPSYCHLAQGVSLDLTGSTLSFDVIANITTQVDGITRPDKDLNILWGAGDNTITGGTFNATPPNGWYGGGLRFLGKYTISNVLITGLKGSWTQPLAGGGTGVEVFAISSQGLTDQSSVSNVTVKDVAPNAYVSGIYIGATQSPTTVVGSTVSSCFVDLGSQNMFAYSSTLKTTFTSCTGYGGSYGLYTDTGDMNAIARSCTLRGTHAAISSVGVGACNRYVAALNCNLTGERCVEWWDKTQSADNMVGGVTVTDSQIDSTYTASVAAKKGNIVMACNTLTKPANVAVGTGSFTPAVMV